VKGLGLLIALAVSAETPAIFRDIDRSMRELSEITGLRAPKRVAYDSITKDRVNQFLKDRVKETVKPGDLRAEELTLKKFGFIPRDFDLAKSTVELLTEQAAAFYDFRKKKLFLTDWASSMRDDALVHELAHALADQNFGLERFMKGNGASDDSSLARMAVMEGQASWLMAEVAARRQSQSLLKNPSLMEALSRGGESESSPYPVFNAMPLYLRETLVFPYTHGMRFQQALAERLGQAAFTEIFRRPPVSTQQILHPETYFVRTAPSRPALPVKKVAGARRLSEGMIGELDLAILLRQYGDRSTASVIATHWRGGSYALWERRQTRQTVLAWAIEADSAAAAAEIFAEFKKVLRSKWHEPRVTGDSANHFEGMGGDGPFRMELSGPIVRIVEGEIKR
jgi:hypothetical protein